MGVLTTIDRAALAAYCQAYARWVEAEQRLRETPPLVKTPSGYVQQSPWLAIANKQLELMGRYMTELGMTPASRSRVAGLDPRMQVPEISFTTIYEEKENETRAAADALREKINAMAKPNGAAAMRSALPAARTALVPRVGQQHGPGGCRAARRT